MSPPSLSVERIEDASRFAALGAEWDALLEASGADGLFLSWDWVDAWWRHLAGERRLYLLAVRRGPELVGVAPFGVAPPQLGRLLPFRCLELLGAGTVGSDYLDVIVRRGWEAAAVEAMAEHLAGERFVMRFGRVRRGSSVAARLAERLAQRGWTCREAPGEVCPFIPLRGHTWESYMAGLGSSHRYNFQRRLKNLCRLHAVEFHRVASEAERGAALSRLIRLHEARWRARGGGSEAFTSAGLVSFHQELTRRALARGRLRLFELRLDGRPAASLYGFRYRDTFSFYQSGFDPDFAKESVGLVTMGLAIRSAIEEGAAEYDLLHGDEAYKSQWAREARELATLEVYPPRLRGLAFRQTVSMGRAARRLARRLLPASVADRLAAGWRPGA